VHLLFVCRLLGTPTEETYPGVTNLPDWNPSFPMWPRLKLTKCAPDLCENGLDILKQLLAYDPRERISARRAMNHPYFDDLDKEAI